MVSTTGQSIYARFISGTKIDANREHIHEQQPKRLVAEIQKMVAKLERKFQRISLICLLVDTLPDDITFLEYKSRIFLLMVVFFGVCCLFFQAATLIGLNKSGDLF